MRVGEEEMEWWYESKNVVRMCSLSGGVGGGIDSLLLGVAHRAGPVELHFLFLLEAELRENLV